MAEAQPRTTSFCFDESWAMLDHQLIDRILMDFGHSAVTLGGQIAPLWNATAATVVKCSERFPPSFRSVSIHWHPGPDQVGLIVSSGAHGRTRRRASSCWSQRIKSQGMAATRLPVLAPGRFVMVGARWL